MDYKKLERELRSYTSKYKTADKMDGANFLTNNIVRTFEKGNKVVEVSWGSGFTAEYMIGVTVQYKHSREDTGESTCFTELELAAIDNFIKEL